MGTLRSYWYAAGCKATAWFNHRSVSLAECAKHAAKDLDAFGPAQRIVVQVTEREPGGGYFVTPKASVGLGTMAEFLRRNVITFADAIEGDSEPPWLAALVASTVPTSAVVVPDEVAPTDEILTDFDGNEVDSLGPPITEEEEAAIDAGIASMLAAAESEEVTLEVRRQAVRDKRNAKRRAARASKA